ncbi:UDP-N-acetylglucosamine pyrophosphorylase [Catovirus CTV1]|uniref:UDP-N-acetylglucosamine diphosphorylase n=1 Tax=Catovirus CTV1 TaxID=1977631 RepID=A0A1V0SB89_9VIRU|nr:UDP-N-acetylglucosamine pyrophosphorylase [Catovirus CTV1]
MINYDRLSTKKVTRVQHKYNSYININFENTEEKSIFVSVHNLLLNNNINIPDILEQTDMSIKMSDLGDDTIYNLHCNGEYTKLTMAYKKTIEELIKLQNIKCENIPSNENIFNIIKNILKKAVDYNFVSKEDSEKYLLKMFEICNKVNNFPKSTIHRDYQSKNIMLFDKNIYIIDYQDLCIGPSVYDIVSLLYDTNICLSEVKINEYLELYWTLTDKSKYESKEYFMKNVYYCAIARLHKSLVWRLDKYYNNGTYGQDIIKNKCLMNQVLKNISKIEDVEFIKDIYNNICSVVVEKVAPIVLAAGKGTRMGIKDYPKPLVKLFDKPILCHIIDNLQHYKDIYVVVGYKKELVMEELKLYENISFVKQEDQLGTGHAVKLALPHINKSVEDVIVIMGDMPTINYSLLNSSLEEHKRHNADATIISIYTKELNPSSGILKNNNKFTKIVEYKDKTADMNLSQEITTGIYIIKHIHLQKHIKNLSNKNNNNEYYITELINIMAQEGGNIHIFDGTEYLYTPHGPNTMEELRTLEKNMEMNK